MVHNLPCDVMLVCGALDIFRGFWHGSNYVIAALDRFRHDFSYQLLGGTMTEVAVFDPLTLKGWQGIETSIPPASPIIGKTVEILEKKYSVRFLHIHNCPAIPQTRCETVPKELELTKEMTVNVWGERQSLRAFLSAIDGVVS